MHEHSITCSILEILDKVIKENKITKIKKINFEISTLANIEPSSIEFYYDFLAKDNNVLKDAKLVFKKKKMKAKCKDCNKISEMEDIFLICCPACSSKNIKAVDTDDIKILSVEA